MFLCRALLVCLLLWTTAAPRALAESTGPPDSRGWDAQADTLFRHLTPSSLHYANGIEQDGQGFIWAGTESGLTRWDGYRSRVYVADPRDDGALPANRILSLHADVSGRLWVGIAAGGLARYDPRRDRFVAYQAGQGGLSDSSVWAIADDGPHGLWIGTGTGLDHIDTETGAIRSVALPNLAHGAVKAALQDRSGALWVGTQQGLYLRAALGQSFVSVPLSVSGRAPVAVMALLQDSAGRIWIATRSHGAFVVEPGTPLPRVVAETGEGQLLRGAVVTSMVEAVSGQIWLGTLGGGIVVVEPEAHWRTHRIRHHVAVATSLQDDDIKSMRRDRSGLVWVSTTLAMNIHDPRRLGVSTLFGAVTRDKPITSVQVPAMAADRDGRVWLSNGDSGGIELLDPANGRVAELRSDATRPMSALPDGRVLAMARAADGSLYLGTQKGLYRADAQGRRVVRLPVQGRPPDAGVFSLCVDDGTLWMGGADGLWALDLRRDGPPEVVRHESAAVVGSDRVTAFLRAGGVLWVGTSNGLNRIDLASGRMQRLAADAKNSSALLAGYVSSLLLDAQGRLWIASVGSGVQVVERQDTDGRLHVRRLSMREGLPHNGIDKLLLDAEGNVWASTDNGLAEIDPSTFAVRTLGEAQGVAILEYWSDSGAKTATGDLLFGGMGGLTVIRPGQTRRTFAPPPVVVTEAHAGGGLMLASSLNGSIAMPGARLEVPAHDHSLMVEFAALDFTAPELNHYSYRLQGFDTEWTDTDASRRLASYTNLPPGDYTLQLRGSGHEAPWTTSTLDIAVRVLPQWYQTAFFRLAVVLAAVLAFVATVQLRTAYLRRRQRELEALVALRTAELVRRGEELHASQQELQKIAYCDPLTGLANRRLFNEDLRHVMALAQRGFGHVTMLLIDLDKFKQVNDTMGHDAGDALLVEVARRLVATVRLSDRVARLGGDEFAVLLTAGVEPGDVEAACRRVVHDLAAPFDHAGRSVEVTASVGAASFPKHASDVEALYKCADLALYDAKTAGRNNWRWFVASSSLRPEPEPEPEPFAG